MAVRLTPTTILVEHTFSVFSIEIEVSKKHWKKVSYVIEAGFVFLEIFQKISERSFNALWTDFINGSQSAFEQVQLITWKA